MNTAGDVELAIRISPGDKTPYTVEVTLDGESRAPEQQPAPLDLDDDELAELRFDWAAYGRALAEVVFADPAIRDTFRRARALADERRSQLRLVLHLPDEAEIQAIQWETLYSPEADQPLALMQGTSFARYLAGERWRPLQPRPRSELRALLVIGELNASGRAKMSAGGGSRNLAALSSAFSSMPHTLLSEPGQVSFAAMRRALREGYDLLCLSVDGDLADEDVTLFFAPGEEGSVRGEQLAKMLGGLLQPPRLALVSFEGGDFDRNRAAATLLGPRLLAAGIPLVLTMQGSLEVGMNAQFLQVFVGELAADGQADRAAGEARRFVGNQADWWTPALFSRVRPARLWEWEAVEQAPQRRPLTKGARPEPDQAEPPVEQAVEAAYLPVQQSVEGPPPFVQQGYGGGSAPFPVEQQGYGGGAAPMDGEAAPEVTTPGLEPAGPVAEQEVQPAPPATEAAPASAEPPGVASVAPMSAPAATDTAAATALPPSAVASSVPPPPGAAPRTAEAAQPLVVLVQQLEARYRPPDTTLSLEIHDDHARFRFDNVDYASPHRLAEDGEPLRAALAADPRQYGELLFAAVFHDESWQGARPTRVGYERARTVSERELRIELNLHHRPFEQLRWEYLADTTLPGKPPLAISERSPLYRRPPVGAAGPAPEPGGALKICVALCSPQQLGQPGNALLKELQPLDLARHQEIVEDALAPLEAAGLASRVVLGAPDKPPATFEAIGKALDDGCNVLHLVAHGLEVAGEYHLVMEHAIAGGQPAFVPAATFAAMLHGHDAELRLVVLGSCKSAATPELPSGGPSLGAALVEGGVPAVVAMQDLVAVNTVLFFTQQFYDDLARSGRVEMAVAATRRDLYQWLQGSSADWGIPVLYMGQSDGHLFDVDLARAARLAPRTPAIKSFAEPAVDTEEIARRVARIAEASEGGSLAPSQIEALRAAVMPAASQVQLAQGQRREQLNGLKRPLLLDAADLQGYVEQQPDGLVLAPAVYRQVASALSNGKHVILTGPPGTGKTSVAQHISRFAVERGLIPGAVTTTASADWTTFDTVGGYMPSPQGVLQFRPGIFLRALAEGQWLVIDEINRAEIDKAFGELFTVLSGQPVDLPYWIGEHQVRIIPGLRERDPARPWVPATVSSPYDYVVHPNWRIVGAMNVYDKSSLFAMSFAFMRRFAFVEIDVPAVQRYEERLVRQWLGPGPTAERIRDELTAAVRELLSLPTLMSRRALGPAIIMDMVRHVAHCAALSADEPLIEHVAEAFTLYAVAQLDALEQETIGTIYGELQGLYGGADNGKALLGRIRELYPHIRGDEWPQPTP
jgi:MoxR-like ATPase